MFSALEPPGAALLHVRIFPQRLPEGGNLLPFSSTVGNPLLSPLLPHEMIVGADGELCDVRDVVVNAPEPLLHDL